jgi:hypothetical protein
MNFIIANLGSVFIVLMMAGFIVTLFEYALFRMMIPFYFKNGPFASISIFRTTIDKDAIANLLEREIDRTSFFVKKMNNNILLSYKPSTKLWFSKGEFPAQRIVLTFLQGDSGTDIRYEVRPFYSAFFLPILIALALIFDVVVPNQYAGMSMKLIGIVVACLIGLALFLPFRPRFDKINKLPEDIGIDSLKRN